MSIPEAKEKGREKYRDSCANGWVPVVLFIYDEWVPRLEFVIGGAKILLQPKQPSLTCFILVDPKRKGKRIGQRHVAGAAERARNWEQASRVRYPHDRQYHVPAGSREWGPCCGQAYQVSAWPPYNGSVVVFLSKVNRKFSFKGLLLYFLQKV